MPDTPTSRSLKKLREEGWTVAVVERWNPYAKIRQDLFGFADLIAMKPGERPLLIQTTSGDHVAARLAKIAANEHSATALSAGFRIVAHGWRKLKVKRGGKAVRWECREEEYV